MINQNEFDKKIDDLYNSCRNLIQLQDIQSDRALGIMLETCEMIGEINGQLKTMIKELLENP